MVVWEAKWQSKLVKSRIWSALWTYFTSLGLRKYATRQNGLKVPVGDSLETTRTCLHSVFSPKPVANSDASTWQRFFTVLRSDCQWTFTCCQESLRSVIFLSLCLLSSLVNLFLKGPPLLFLFLGAQSLPAFVTSTRRSPFSCNNISLSCRHANLSFYKKFLVCLFHHLQRVQASLFWVTESIHQVQELKYTKKHLQASFVDYN